MEDGFDLKETNTSLLSTGNNTFQMSLKVSQCGQFLADRRPAPADL